MMGKFRSTQFAQRFFRLSICSWGEDEGDGFERTRLKSIFTLPSLLNKKRRPRALGVVQVF
jgi:hypothetical protein